MNDYTYRDGSGREYKRISRSAARRLYENYKTVVFCPCNLRPGPPWHPEAYLNKGVNGNDFQIIENAYYFYNIRTRCPASRKMLPGCLLCATPVNSAKITMEE